MSSLAGYLRSLAEKGTYDFDVEILTLKLTIEQKHKVFNEWEKVNYYD